MPARQARALAGPICSKRGLPEGTYTITLEESLRHPVTDGFHTCWFDDGTRVSPPPALTSGACEAVGTIVVAD